MQKKTKLIILFVILIFSVLIKLINTIPFDTFNDDDSYYTLRQIDALSSEKHLLYDDELSFSGKQSVFLPAFYVIMGIIYSLFGSIMLLKVIVIIFTSLSAIIIFLIIENLTKNDYIAAFLSLCSIFIPVLIKRTTNTLTPLTLTIPLVLICLYLFSEYGKSSTKSLLYIVFLFILCTTSPHSLIFLITIIIYIILLKTEQIPLSKDKKEIAIFSSIFIVWINLIFFKKAIQMHGINIIWQNIPTELIINYYSSLDMISILYFIGIIPFIFAVYGLYNHVYKTKKSELYVYVAFVASVFLILLFRLVQLEIGLIYLGLSFMIFSSLGVNDFIIYIKKTKSSKYLSTILGVVVFFFIITSLFPGIQNISNDRITPETIDALNWIKENTTQDSVIIGTFKEGNLISSIAKRKNVIDTNFLLTKNINERFQDIKTIYTSPLSVKPLEIANKYDVDYILLDRARKEYNIKDLRFNTSSSIEEVYNNNSIKIYKIKGRVEKYD